MQTFASFVVSDCSRAAVAAALAVAEGSEHAPNALFLVGPTGSGKSHLLHAIAHAIRSRRPNTRILHETTRRFVDLLIHAIRSDELHTFRESHFALDVLLLDDFRFTSDMVHTKEEVLRTVEECVSRGVHVAVASERPPSDSSRSVEIGYPDIDARVEIARRAAAFRSVTLSDDTLRYLAEQLPGTPRVLQSVIARISAEASISSERLDLEHVHRIVNRL